MAGLTQYSAANLMSEGGADAARWNRITPSQIGKCVILASEKAEGRVTLILMNESHGIEGALIREDTLCQRIPSST